MGGAWSVSPPDPARDPPRCGGQPGPALEFRLASFSSLSLVISVASLGSADSRSRVDGGSRVDHPVSELLAVSQRLRSTFKNRRDLLRGEARGLTEDQSDDACDMRCGETCSS